MQSRGWRRSAAPCVSLPPQAHSRAVRGWIRGRHALCWALRACGFHGAAERTIHLQALCALFRRARRSSRPAGLSPSARVENRRGDAPHSQTPPPEKACEAWLVIVPNLSTCIRHLSRKCVPPRHAFRSRRRRTHTRCGAVRGHHTLCWALRACVFPWRGGARHPPSGALRHVPPRHATSAPAEVYSQLWGYAAGLISLKAARGRAALQGAARETCLRSSGLRGVFGAFFSVSSPGTPFTPERADPGRRPFVILLRQAQDLEPLGRLGAFSPSVNSGPSACRNGSFAILHSPSAWAML